MNNHITIRRKKEYWNFVRPFNIYIDGQFVGRLKNGESRLFPVANGKHTIQAKQAISFLGSKKLQVDLDSNQNTSLKISTSIVGIVATIMTFAILSFAGLAGFLQLGFGGMLFTFLPVPLLFLFIVFFVRVNHFLVIKV